MTGEPFVVGIAGGTGAGKTSVADDLAEAVGEPVTRIPVDNYYEDLSHLPREERAEVNYDHPSAIEWELLLDHLDRLRAGETIQMPEYDFTVHDRKEERITVEPTPILVLEGIFALHDRVRDHLDLEVYVETDADVRILRRIRRDVVDRGRDLEGVMDQYLSTVKPMHERHVAPTRERADVIIPEGTNTRAVRLLTERVKAALAEGDRERWDENGDRGGDGDRPVAGSPPSSE